MPAPPGPACTLGPPRGRCAVPQARGARRTVQPRQSPLLPRPPRSSFPKCRLILTSSHSRGPRALGQGVRATVPCQHAASKCTLPKTTVLLAETPQSDTKATASQNTLRAKQRPLQLKLVHTAATAFEPPEKKDGQGHTSVLLLAIRVSGRPVAEASWLCPVALCPAWRRPEPQGPSAGDPRSTAVRTDEAKDTSEKGSFSRAGCSQPGAGEARPAFAPQRTSSASRMHGA